MTRKDWRNTAKNKRGIIFFKDYWQRDNEVLPTGDHIDLWNGETLTAASLQGRLNNFLRFTVGLGSARYSDLGKSKKILLREVA
ncbi:T6SS effector amidase Tae4 family protein [Cupriavidus basilensis]